MKIVVLSPNAKTLFTNDHLSKLKSNGDLVLIDQIKPLVEKVLDNLLYEGMQLKDKWRLQYADFQRGSVEGSVISKSIDAEIEAWIKKVEDYISYNLPEHHLLFHFTVPPLFVPQLIHSFGHQIKKMDMHLKALEEVILWIKEQTSLKTRLEIAELENNAQILYRVKHYWHARDIHINDFLLSRPHAEGQAMRFFDYVYDRPNEPIPFEVIAKACGLDTKTKVDDLLRDLKFVGDFRTVFFPRTTKMTVNFINPITRTYALKEDLPRLKISPLDFGEK